MPECATEGLTQWPSHRSLAKARPPASATWGGPGFCLPPTPDGKGRGHRAPEAPLDTALPAGSPSPAQPEGCKVTPHLPPLHFSIHWIHRHTH